MSLTHTYTVNLDWEKGRKGVMNAPDVNSTLEVVTPPQFPNGIPDIWSPEHLFVAAVNSCLMTTFLAIADNSKLGFKDFSSKGEGKLEMKDGKYMITEVTLYPVLTIEKEEDMPKAERILQKSEAACLISNSVKSAIIFRPEITVAN